MTDSGAETPVFAEELVTEAWCGPSLAYVEGHAQAVCTRVHGGGRLAAEDVDSLVTLLGDRTAFLAEPQLQANRVAVVRRLITAAVLVQALRMDDPGLLRRLRKVTDVYIGGPPRMPVTPRCLHALVDGVGAESLSQRQSAMRLCGDLVGSGWADLTPVVGVVIAELSSPEEGRGLRHVTPAVAARETLVRWGMVTDDLDGLCVQVAAAVDPAGPSASALRALAGLYAVGERFDALPGLVGRANTRTAVIGGIRDAFHAQAFNVELRRPIPNPTYPFDRAIDVAHGLCTNVGHREVVAGLRQRYQRLGRQ